LPYLLPLPESGKSFDEIQSDYQEKGEYIETDFGKVFITTTGDANNEAMVLVHSFGGSSNNWVRVIDKLVEQEFFVIAIDLPGFGVSERQDGAVYSHEKYAKVIKQVTDALNIEKAVFVGHSMGVNVLLWVYKIYPEIVDSFVFVDGNNVAMQSSSTLVNNVLVQPYFQRGLRQILLRSLSKDRIRGILESAVYKKETVNEELIERYFVGLSHKGWDQSLISLALSANQNVITKDEVNNIKVPTLILWGKEDAWISLQDGLVFSRLFSEADFVVIPEAGHLVMEEEPELLSLAVRSFFMKQGSKIQEDQ